MAEGDTIHRAAARLQEALAGKRLDLVEAPNPRSPLHDRVGSLSGGVIERAQARGKHLLLHFVGDRVIHAHLGVEGAWVIRARPAARAGKPWLLLGAGEVTAALTRARLLRLVSAARARNDPVLLRLGPDPLEPGFDQAHAARRLLAAEPAARAGEVLLDQTVLAGVGNVIRIEALWLAGVSPWRRIGELTRPEAGALVQGCREVMEATLRTGRRPKRIYGARAREPCPRCGGRIRRGRQGDDARLTLWCESCQT